MKLGFIGTGNMATAIIQGIIEQKFIEVDEIFIYDNSSAKAEELSQKLGVNVSTSNKALVHQVDVIILAVKPNVIGKVLMEIKAPISEKKPLLISIAAGISLDSLKKFLQTDEPVSIVRVMPNINAMIGMGAAAVCGNEVTTSEQTDYVVQLFNALGKAWLIEEKDFANYSAIAGCSPAYAYLFIDSIARAGVKNGLPKDLCTEIAAQAVLGSAQMILETGENPWTLIDKVCSPGGTTVAGLIALEDEKFISTVVGGIEAAIKKDKVLAEENK